MKNKKVILFLIAVLCAHFGYAQDESDALRYSFLTPGGSARLQATGGAGISLGGEPSLVNSNPAAIGLFKSSDLSITANLKTSNLNGDYYNLISSDSKTSFSVPQMELIIASGNRNRNSKWKNFTFGIGLNRLANYNQNILYKGNNKNSSYADQYLNTLDQEGYGNSQSDYDDIGSNYPYGLSQAFQTGLIFPVVDGNNNFQYWQSLSGDVLDNNLSLQQTSTISTKGGTDEFSLAFAGNYNDRLIIGGGLFVPSINFDRKTTFKEAPVQPDSILNFYQVSNSLHTNGVGINGKFGLIYLINSNWRVGASIHTPTYYSMHDSYSTTMITDTKDQGRLTSTTGDFTDGYSGDYDYSMTTPWRVMGGLSYVLGNISNAITNGFISLDYEYVNYAAARFHFNSSNSTADDKAYAKSLNKSIKDMYKGASNIRLGAELKFNTIAARAGIAYMGSPYDESYLSDIGQEDLSPSQLQYSVGLGIRTRGFYADLSYVYTDRGERLNQPYYLDPDSNPKVNSPNPAVIYGHNGNILLTVGFKL